MKHSKERLKTMSKWQNPTQTHARAAQSQTTPVNTQETR